MNKFQKTLLIISGILFALTVLFSTFLPFGRIVDHSIGIYAGPTESYNFGFLIFGNLFIVIFGIFLGTILYSLCKKIKKRPIRLAVIFLGFVFLIVSIFIGILIMSSRGYSYTW